METNVSIRCVWTRWISSSLPILAVTAAALGMLFQVGLPTASAQVGQPQPMPKQEYYYVFEEFYQGEFRSAQKNFKSLSRRASILVGGRFLDSVVYWTMLGESHYRLGEYSLALEQYEAALSLYMTLQRWPDRTDPVAIAESQGNARRAAQVPWAVSGRSPRYGGFQQKMLVRLGNTPAENEAILRGGGVIDPSRLQSVDIAEVMRCVALAVYRRHMIKGPIAAIDPFTKQLTTKLLGNGGGTVTSAWPGIAKGIALASLGDNSRAAQLLRSSLQIGGYDHPLTPIALLTLGKIAADENKTDEAQKLFMEASIAAAAFEQYDMVEEALRYGALIHASARTSKPYQPLVAAIDWARKANRDTLQASLMTTAAMVAAESGDSKAAAVLLQNAKREMNRNDLKRTSIFTNWLYVDAMINYLKADIKNGDRQFGEFLKAAQGTSFWLFQIALADNAVKEGAVTEREAETLYDLLLREPTDADWSYRPEEAMAFLATPHYEPMERWFEITLSRKAEEKAIGIAELIRRQRFFSTQLMGGRLIALRWVLEAPAEALSANALIQKESLLLRYPEYRTLSDHAATLRKQLEELPIAPDKGTDEHQKQKILLEELANVVDSQEISLRMIALIRDPCELAFPQPLSVADIQQKLKPDQLIVSFLKAGQSYYVMKLSASRYTIESQIQAKVLDRKILQLTQALNIGDKAMVHDPAVFLENDWQQIAGQISELIFAKTEPQAIESLEEVIFIPDSKAWYLPMEILQVGSAEESVNLSDRVRVRYAPMAALAVPDERKSRRFRRAAIVAERNFLKDDEARIAQGLAEVQAALPAIEKIEKTTQGPSALLGSTIDQLIVWHVSNEKSRSAFEFSPLQLDAGRPGSDLQSWMMLPWRGIDQVILSGVSSAIEGSTRARADGSELFLSTTALMASGTRTILISRWRVGGQSSLDLTREFAQGLGKQSASRAWHRSLGLLKDSEIDNTAEPRLREKVLDQPLKGDHPYFWAGYMLIDSGYDPVPSEDQTDNPGTDDSGN